MPKQRATISGMSQITLVNPVPLPENLNAAEQKFVDCMAQGKGCKIDDIRPTKAIDTNGENANVIRAELISFFALGGSEHAPIKNNIIDLCGAYISGALNLSWVSSSYALGLMNCHFEDSVDVSYATFRFLELTGSYLTYGLQAEGIKIEDNIFMNDGFCADGQVRLIGANIGGELDCGGGKFKNTFSSAFAADRIKVGGNISMNEGFVAEGRVRLLNANIGGLLNCKGGKFKKEDYALVAEGIRVKNNVFMRYGFCAEGEVSLQGADIGGVLYCNGGEFKRGFNAKAAKVRNSLHWQNVKGGGTFDLSFAKADVLEDDEKSRENFDFLLDGFSYKQFQSPGDVESRIEWLKKRPKGVEFSPQPFEHAAKVLFAMGKSRDAREVLFAMEQHITEEKNISRWNKFKRQLWEITTGYNYRLRRMLATSAFIVVVGATVFGAANHYGYIVPHQPVVLNLTQDQKALKDRECESKKRPTEVVECLLPEHPPFQPFIYSMDIFIPLFNLHQEPYWYPKPSANAHIAWRFILPVWYWFEIFMGWILTSLLVLTITGLLRPRQSSGVE